MYIYVCMYINYCPEARPIFFCHEQVISPNLWSSLPFLGMHFMVFVFVFPRHPPFSDLTVYVVLRLPVFIDWFLLLVSSFSFLLSFVGPHRGWKVGNSVGPDLNLRASHSTHDRSMIYETETALWCVWVRLGFTIVYDVGILQNG